MSNNPYHIEVNEEGGYIRIARHSREMLYWQSYEWEVDAELVFTIVNIINRALTNPDEMDLYLKTIGKI